MGFVLLCSVVFYGLLQAVLSSRSEDVNCVNFFKGASFEYVWRSGAMSGVGAIDFNSNGTVTTWDAAGTMLATGTYKISQSLGSSWCYIQEDFTWPDEQHVCNTKSVDTMAQTLVGCSSDTACFDSCESPEQWAQWHAARLTSREYK